MTRHLWTLIVGAVPVLILAPGGVGSASNTAADDDKETKEARAAVLKIADLIEKKQYDDAKKEAQALAKKVDEMKPVMKSLALRSNGGVGFGAKAGAFTPDGIEAKLINSGRKEMSAADLKAQAEALERMSYITAAVAEVALAKPPAKKVGDKDPKEWLAWSKDMRESALKLADAAKAQDAKAVKESVNKLYLSCTSCHKPFKPN